MISRLKYRVAAVVLTICGLSSCIKNDIPYPIVPLSLEAIYGDGIKSVSCDTKNLILNVELAEKTNIKEVVVDSVKYTPEATLSQPLVGVLNLKYPIDVTLSFYQKYKWNIVATQPIERYFSVQGQIGAEIIDTENRTITALVDTTKTDRKAIIIEKLKIGPADITSMSLDISGPVQFVTYKRVDVKYHDVTERWKLYVEHTDVKVTLTLCEAWATSAWLEAAGDTANECGFRYRAKGSEEWITVPSEDVELGSGTFSTQIKGLTPESEYEFIAYSGADLSLPADRTSDAATQMPNSGFEEWSQQGAPWFPYFDSNKFWSTGNEGATTIGASYNLTTPSDDIRPGSKGTQSAQLKSRNVLIKFAAGNLFVGNYVRTDITHGVVGFGQPFVSRPTALRGWVKYIGQPIDCVGATKPPGVDIVKNETPDIGMIYIALGDWTKEEYGTNPGNPSRMEGTDATPIVIYTRHLETLFNPESEGVIAYGEYQITENIEGWKQFTIPLDYHSMDRIPTHITVVCSASKYGDYFTGGDGSLMMLDDFELIYE